MLAYLWAAPGSLIGLLLSLGFARRYRRGGVIVAEGARWPARLGWHYRAITFGHVVLCCDRIDARLMAHELAHVRQWERWGPVLLIAYPLASLTARLRGGHAHRDNPFEIAARAEAEEHPG